MKILRFLSIPVLASLMFACTSTPDKLPNILWITSEDNSRLLGCYGDEFATTPNLDQLATEGFLYTNAYANTPVCAPARNTIITGVHACSAGNEQMRSYYPKSDIVLPYTQYLKEKGYYITNNSKKDYNMADMDSHVVWDECSDEAHYKNRAEGQPFFAIFNTTISHESCIHKSIPDSLLRHSPNEVPLPPYHPNTPEMRHDWAQYYDKVEDMDARMGKILAELEEAGLAENTIVFYYSDHGGVLGRSKRFLYETGTHVPMIIRIPEKYKHLFPAEGPGSRVDRLVSFVDLAPTLLSLIGMEAPGYMQGSAFLGKHKGEEPENIYMFRERMDERYDMSRSIVDGHYRYTRNFNSNRPYGQYLEYLWRAPSMQSWDRAYKAGECNEIQSIFWESKAVEELYDIHADPWEVNNLAGDPAHADRLEKMRLACKERSLGMMDAGFLPEAERIARFGGSPAYDYMRSGKVDVAELHEAAWTASLADPRNVDQLLNWLKHEDSGIRYWAAQGLLLLGEEARPHLDAIQDASSDPSWNVRVCAAESMYLLGEKAKARDVFAEVLSCDQQMARVHALNSIDCIEGPAEEFAEMVLGVADFYEDGGRNYDQRSLGSLKLKWGLAQ